MNPGSNHEQAIRTAEQNIETRYKDFPQTRLVSNFLVRDNGALDKRMLRIYAFLSAMHTLENSPRPYSPYEIAKACADDPIDYAEVLTA